MMSTCICTGKGYNYLNWSIILNAFSLTFNDSKNCTIAIKEERIVIMVLEVEHT